MVSLLLVGYGWIQYEFCFKWNYWGGGLFPVKIIYMIKPGTVPMEYRVYKLHDQASAKKANGVHKNLAKYFPHQHQYI